MERKTWGPFTGTHLTIMFTAAVLATVPTALWSVDAFNNVAIQDPVSGKKVAVDAARQMFVRDQVGDWDETPANFVRQFGTPPRGSCGAFYVVPAGKALIVKSIHTYIVKGAGPFAEVDFFMNAGCTQPLATALSNQSHENQRLDFGAGVAVPAGRTVGARAFNNSSTAILYGYLVPAGWVPANAVSSEPQVLAPGQPVSMAAPRS